MMMALGYRKKSPERCAEEVKRMHSLGFNEFWLTDDIFTSDQEWAVKVSEAISRSGVKMAWTCSNGIRVESADERLFEAMKRSGCYRVTFGFESGNDEVLKKFGKGGRATVEQGKVAIQKASDAGLDTFGAFMIGLSCDTEETIQDTIDFAYTLPFHYGKFGMAIAFPGTEMFNNYVKKGLIRSFDWDEYFLYTDEQLFAHENLDYATIQKYIKAAYRKVITLNPRFFFRRLFSGLRSGDFFLDLYYGLKFFVLPAASEKVLPNYYAKDRWPVYNFSKYPPKEIPYQVVGKKEAYQMEQNPLSAKSPVS